MRSIFLPVALTLSAVLAGCSAQAQQRQQREVMKACSADVKSVCPDVKRGDGAIAQCLRDNQDKLGDGCKTALQAAAAERKQSGAASAPTR